MQVSSMYRLHIGSEDIIFQMPSLLNDNIFSLVISADVDIQT